MGEKMKTIKQVGAIVGVIALMLSSLYSTQSIAADKFPSKTIEMTVLFGGTAKSVGDLVAKGLEKEALTDAYFVDRKLYPNVDFYSGIIYRAMGIPVEMFTVMFALGRLPGWIGQWREMRLRKEPIGRPRQIYTGSTLRPFKSVAKQ